MGKSRQQKSSEALQVERLQQEVDANKWMSDFGKSMADLSTRRLKEQEDYLKGEVDPQLKGYAKTGFAPGERRLLRARSEEDTARIFNQGEKRTLGGMARMGFSSRAPSGAMARARLGMGRGRAEARVKGLRDIETQGYETRKAAVPLMMQRAGGFDPQTTMSAGLNFGRPTSGAPKPVFEPGFWGKAGRAVVGAAKIATPFLNTD